MASRIEYNIVDLVQISVRNVKSFCCLVRWAYKAKRRHAPGTGRLRHVKVVNRRFQ